MIKHVVFFKLKNNDSDECMRAKEVLLSMKDHIPYIRDIKAGVDFLRSERSFDVILEVTLDDKKALDDYQDNPYHVNIVKTYIQAIRTDSASVDYEID